MANVSWLEAGGDFVTVNFLFYTLFLRKQMLILPPNLHLLQTAVSKSAFFFHCNLSIIFVTFVFLILIFMSAQNTLITENLQLLDNTLGYLMESDTLSLYIDDLRIKLVKETDKKLELTNTNNNSVDDLFADIFTKQSQKTKNLIKISEVLLLLESEKLIRLIEQNHIRITYKGIIQHSKGYLTTYNSEQYDKNRLDAFDKFQRSFSNRMLWINGAIAVGTLVAMVYYFLEIVSTPYCFCK